MVTCRTNRMGRRAFLTAVAGGIGAAVLPAVPATAAAGIASADLPTRVGDTAAAIEEAETALASAEQTETRAAAAAEQADAEAQAAASRAEAAATGERAAGRELAMAEAKTGRACAALGHLTSEAYRSAAGVAQPAVLPSATSPVEFATRLDGLRQLMASQTQIVDQAAADADRAAVAHERRVTELRRAERESQSAAAKATKAADQHAAATRARKAAGEAVKAARRALTDLQTELAGASESAALVAGKLVLQRPVSGRVTSPFGMRKHPVTGARKLHTGTDLGASCGHRVRAAAAGQVSEAGFDPAYGNRVVVDHGRIAGVSVTTTYSHLDSIATAEGDHLGIAALVGTVGTTGLSTGCHLHFEVLVAGEFTDPMAWMTT